MKTVVRNYPAKFSVHRKVGAFQLSPIMPTWQEERATKDGVTYSNWKVTKEGAVMIEMAPFKEEKNGNFYYDWSKEKKVSFALGVPDIGTILDKSGTKFSLVHSVNDGDVKTFQVTPGEGQYEGTLNISLTHKVGKDIVAQARVAFNAAEWLVFTSLIETALVDILGWSGRVATETNDDGADD